MPGNGHNEQNCNCNKCFMTNPHPLLCQLSNKFKEKSPNNSINLEVAILLIGDKNIENGSEEIYVGGFKDGLPHGDGSIIKILKKVEGYNSKNIDSFYEPLIGANTDLLHHYYRESGTILHDSEFPLILLHGIWNKGKFKSGLSFKYDHVKNVPICIYAGLWENNLPNGQGQIFRDDGGIYYGEVVNGLMHGKGKIDYPNGRKSNSMNTNKIEGDWYEDEFHGIMKFLVLFEHSEPISSDVFITNSHIPSSPNITHHVEEVEFFHGIRVGPRVIDQYNGENKIAFTVNLDIEGTSVMWYKDLLGNNKNKVHYFPILEQEMALSATSSEISSSDFEKFTGSTAEEFGIGTDTIKVPSLPPFTQEKMWISENSQFIIRNSENKILGWIKDSARLNNENNKQIFIVLPDLSYYQGEVDENLVPHGIGTYTFPGNVVKISGRWTEGIIHDGGIYFSNNVIYSGKFNNGKPILSGKYYQLNKIDGLRGLRKIKDKSALRKQLKGIVGKNIWSKKSNLFKWNLKLLDQISSVNNATKSDKLIQDEESQILEFKSSIWATFRNDNGEQVIGAKKNYHTEDSIIKTIAAFSNTDGGKLVIGVQDRPERKVIGIEADLEYSGGEKDFETYQNSLSELIRKSTKNESIIGTSVNIHLEKNSGKTICIVTVKKKHWVWVDLKTIDGGKPSKDVFFVRSGPQTKKLSAESAHEWRKSRE